MILSNKRNIDHSEIFYIFFLNLGRWISCFVKSSIFSSIGYFIQQRKINWVVLVEGLTRNVITNFMNLFPIWTNSSGGDVSF